MPHKDPEEARRRRVARNARVRAELAAIKLERGCVDCGYKGHWAALDFDHVFDTKSFNLGDSAARDPEKVKAEIAKCEVVCANCHRIRTFHRRREAALANPDQEV